MSLDTAFDAMQTTVNVDPDELVEARSRRDLFRDALPGQDDVDRAFPSGSLARGSHADPIHDVDVDIEYEADQHLDWGLPGESAGLALSHVGGQVNLLLGATNGTIDQRVRLALPKNHCVKCFLDDPDDPGGFTVDVMPALRQDDGTLLIPEKANDIWVPADPEDLIRRVRARHLQWGQFVKLVRVLKRWNTENAAGMKSLLVEVLALDHLPKESSRPAALARFFTAAAVAVGTQVCDPAGLCGPIQPDLDVATARARLSEAASKAAAAVAAEQRGDFDDALCLWRSVFGPVFPEPACGCDRASGMAKRAAAVAAVVRTRPRRVVDAPQG